MVDLALTYLHCLLETFVSNGLLVLLGLTALVGIWSVVLFNRLVRSRNQMNNAFAQIDVQL